MLKDHLIATFADETALVDAVTNIRARGFRIYDVYAPFPVHGLDEAMGLRRSRLGLVTLAGGVAGLVGALTFEFYAAVVDWSINVGGKPGNSTLAFIPIAFEMAILGGGLATAAAFLFRSGLFPGAPVKLAGPRVTNDTFAIALRWKSTVFDTGEVRRLLLDSGAIEITQTVVDL